MDQLHVYVCTQLDRCIEFEQLYCNAHLFLVTLGKYGISDKTICNRFSSLSCVLSYKYGSRIHLRDIQRKVMMDYALHYIYNIIFSAGFPHDLRSENYPLSLTPSPPHLFQVKASLAENIRLDLDNALAVYVRSWEV